MTRVFAFSFAGRLRSDESGIAMTEFAFAAPFLLALLLGGLEVANYALAHQKVSQIAMTVADNAGRVEPSIDEAQIYEVFEGARLIGRSLDFEENGRIVLSSLEHNNRNGRRKGQVINWQRCMGDLNVNPAYGEENDGNNDDSLEDGLGPEGNRIVSAQGTAVMFVEVTYDYQPLISDDLIQDRRIRHESAFNVRERVTQDITNTQELEVNDCD
jgi:hypothetical protein